MKIVLVDPINFNELIIRKGLSKRGLARAANIGESTALHISAGSRSPSPATAAKIVNALGVDFDEVFMVVPAELIPEEVI